MVRKKSVGRHKRSIRLTQGITIKVCCASCAFKMYDEEGERVCCQKQRPVKKTEHCGKWFLNRSLRTVGRYKGEVKSKHYLRYVMRTRLKEEAALKNETITLADYKSIEQIRQEYTQKFGLPIFVIK